MLQGARLDPHTDHDSCFLIGHKLQAQADLKSRAEEYTYKSYGNSGQPMDMRNDQGAVGLSKICTLAKQVSA
jgi:hypothetical protein